MKHQIVRTIAALTVAAAALGTTACEVRKTQEGEMPEVKVEGGQVPKFDVDAPDVRVESEKKEITVPDIDIVTPEEKRQGGNVEPGDAPKPAETTPVVPPAQSNPPPAE